MAPVWEGTLIQKWVPLSEYTETVPQFFDILRSLSYLFDVTIVINQHDYQEGIHVVGKEYLVNEFTTICINIVKKVEEVTGKCKINHLNRKMTFDNAKASLKRKCIELYLRELRRLYNILDPDPLMGDRVNLRKEYIKQSSLRTKKILHAESPTNHDGSGK